MNNENIYELLSQTIFNNDLFIRDYKNLILKELIDRSIELSPETCKRLLESAAIMACSDNDNHQIISLNISSKIIELCENDFLRSIAEFILTRLGNFPLLIMSKKEFNIPDYFNILDEKYSINLPLKLKGETIIKKAFNKITVGEELIYLTDFQSRVINNLKIGKNISVAAPTSAGKSYILLKYITNFVKDHNKRCIIIYIVPTRALISQVQRDLKRELEKYSMNDIQVHSSSNYAIDVQEDESAKAILVLTPERLQIIRANINKLSVDLLIVDETQKIEEGSRGITLEECVQQVVDLNPIS